MADNVERFISKVKVEGVDYTVKDPNASEPGDATITIKRNNVTVDSFTTNQMTDKAINIPVPTTASSIGALPDTTKYGNTVELSINDSGLSADYVVTVTLKDQDGNALSTDTIDLPLESVVVGGRYDSTNKKVILELQNGNTVDFSVADLVSGLQTQIGSTNKISADYVDDASSSNKFVTASEKTAIGNVHPNHWITGSTSSTGMTLTVEPADGDSSTGTGYPALGDTYDMPNASTSQYGVTKLSSATNSTSTTLAATASAVKAAYDLANGKLDSTAVSSSGSSGSSGWYNCRLNNGYVQYYNSDTTYSNATTSSAGLMSATDKTKLDTIDERYHYILPVFNYDTTTEKTYLALHAYTESDMEVIDDYPTTVQVPLANANNAKNSGFINGFMYLSGSGNVVTGISLSNGTFTITKGMNAMSAPSAGSGISVSQGGTGSTTLTSNAILAGNGTSAVKKISTVSGALYATSSGGAASFGTLPVAQGGTGATSASSARSNLGLGSAATYSATSSVTSGSSSLVTSGAVYNAINALGIKEVTLTYANLTFTKSYGGLYYSSATNLSSDFSAIYAATIKDFNNTKNLAIQPVINGTKLSICICDPTAPSTLSITSGSMTFVVFGKLA